MFLENLMKNMETSKWGKRLSSTKEYKRRPEWKEHLACSWIEWLNIAKC